eukprot:scaffold185_cov321-Prasinococcus_capsulatus_cf.AAC.1
MSTKTASRRGSPASVTISRLHRKLTVQTATVLSTLRLEPMSYMKVVTTWSQCMQAHSHCICQWGGPRRPRLPDAAARTSIMAI